MAFIMEQAGGSASTGSIPILDVQPEKLHQRCPVILGSKEDVQDVLNIIQRHASQEWICSNEIISYFLNQIKSAFSADN